MCGYLCSTLSLFSRVSQFEIHRITLLAPRSLTHAPDLLKLEILIFIFSFRRREKFSLTIHAWNITIEKILIPTNQETSSEKKGLNEEILNDESKYTRSSLA